MRAEKDRMEALRVAEGELRKLTPADKAAAAAARKAEQARADTLDGLIALGRSRGYPNPQGWAWHTWSKRNARRMNAAAE
jgi:hypothetical protein